LISWPLAVGAQQGKMSFTITPSLFKPNLSPGETWGSSFKIANNSSAGDLTVYAAAVNFTASDESGHAKFLPITDGDKSSPYTLASWIEVSDAPIVVPREKSVKVDFIIRIPENAEPGGHYAAILVGNRPIKDAGIEGPSILVSSMLSTLFFVNVAGDVTEGGFIREFSIDKSFYQTANAEFTVNFENTGNVHLQPQGDITIFNMWGKERGRVLINHKTSFGNVLPQSNRKFVFEWKGENALLDIGRYRAEATLAFGEKEKQTTTSIVYFWVVPVKPLATVLGGFLIFIFFIVFLIRLYIKRALALSLAQRGYIVQAGPPKEIPQERPGGIQKETAPKRIGKKINWINILRIVTVPAYEGYCFLRDSLKIKRADKEPKKSRFRGWAITILVVLSSALVFAYFVSVLTSERQFEIKVKQEQGTGTEKIIE